MRLQQTELDRHPRNFRSLQFIGGYAAPAAEHVTRGVDVLFAQGLRDFGETVTETAEPHRHVKHGNTPRQRQKHTGLAQQRINGDREQRQRQHRDQPRNHAVIGL